MLQCSVFKQPHLCHCSCQNTELSYVNDHLVEECLVLRKIFQQLIFGHPHVVLTFPNIEFCGTDHLRLEKETLPEEFTGLGDNTMALHHVALQNAKN
jgi:hypothetical protein